MNRIWDGTGGFNPVSMTVRISVSTEKMCAWTVTRQAPGPNTADAATMPLDSQIGSKDQPEKNGSSQIVEVKPVKVV